MLAASIQSSLTVGKKKVYQQEILTDLSILEVFGLIFGTKFIDNVIKIDSSVQISTNLFGLLLLERH